MVVVNQKLMSGEKSDREDTGESEVELRLPHGTGLKPDRIPQDIPAAMGTTGADTDTCDPGQTRRLEAVGGAKPKRLPVRETSVSHRLPPNAGRDGEAEDRRVFVRPADPGV